MATSSISTSTTTTSSTPPHNNLRIKSTVSLVFLLLFLVTLFLFTKRELEPKLYFYRDLFITHSPSSTSGGIILPGPDIHPGFNTSAAEILDNSGFSEVPTSKKSNLDAKSDEKSDVPTSPSSDSIGENGVELVGTDDATLHFQSGVTNGNSNKDQVAKLTQSCDLYQGSWVKDEEYPLYSSGSCPYVDEAFDCQNNGRPDSDYLKWRWKPDNCVLPRFNATDFLVRLRGKKIMLVGDSMNRNQYESLLCLLREGLENKSRMYEVRGYKITKGRGQYTFKFEDYDCTVDFVRSHFLVKEGTRVNGRGSSNPTLSIDTIDKSSSRWKRADILVFNTGHWWTHGKTARGKNYYKEGDYLHPQLDSVEAYKRALTTWGKWIDDNISPRSLVFYRGYSSAHFRGGDWDSGGSCKGETEPVFNGSIIDSYPLKMKIVDEVIKGMQVPVMLLNVTKLTNFRKDGHPSVYGSKGVVSKKRQDCSHWCLPGVPDAWNELIYATLVAKEATNVPNQ